MVSQIRHFIDGKLVAGRDARTAPVFNPATGEQTGEVGLATAAEVSAAVEAARAAAESWSDTPSLRRARILNRFLRIVEDRIDELAAVITSEHGKTLSDARGEIQRGLEVVEFAVGGTAAPEGRSQRECRDTG
ncbi:acyl-CoA reductase-like NAD-dependent aldehyde dehydrogenase [Bradyrhizobium sp. OAE829]